LFYGFRGFGGFGGLFLKKKEKGIEIWRERENITNKLDTQNWESENLEEFRNFLRKIFSYGILNKIIDWYSDWILI
jgi:hypothetical protein